MRRISHSRISCAFGLTLVGVLAGCVVEGPRHGVYAPPPPVVHVETQVVVQDDYVYYPSYEVYYSSRRQNYIYLEGRTWVTRPSPPRVSVGVLFASPSVRLDFHDSPARHHTTVIKQYPRHWAPPGHDNDHRDRDDHDNGRGKGKGKGGRD
jgi:hypothetical protein